MLLSHYDWIRINHHLCKSSWNFLRRLYFSISKYICIFGNENICCISNSYFSQASPNCRAEAQYAFRLKKPIIPVRVQDGYIPDGWLGTVLFPFFLFYINPKRSTHSGRPVKIYLSFQDPFQNQYKLKDVDRLSWENPKENSIGPLRILKSFKEILPKMQKISIRQWVWTFSLPGSCWPTYFSPHCFRVPLLPDRPLPCPLSIRYISSVSLCYMAIFNEFQYFSGCLLYSDHICWSRSEDSY